MTTPEENAKALTEASQMNLNLQSALGELENQFKMMSNRCATIAAERDNAIRYAKQLEEKTKNLEERIDLLLQCRSAEAELVPLSETKKARKTAVTN